MNADKQLNVHPGENDGMSCISFYGGGASILQLSHLNLILLNMSDSVEK